MEALNMDTKLPAVMVECDDAKPYQSRFIVIEGDDWEVEEDDSRKLPAVVTPTASKTVDQDKTPGTVDTTESGDTASETSVASSKEALDILFGKEEEPEDEQQAVPEETTEEEPEEKDSTDDDGVNGQASKPASADLPSPPRRLSRVSITAANFDRPQQVAASPAPRRSTIAGSGLSELSKQLRVLQAKNQYMQSEMERLQRQMRILTESKGVSVADVLSSLESACAKEAHAELRSQIDGLQAQLEALRASKSPSRATKAGAMSKATQLEHESLKQQIAALQLQVGNFEELEAKYKEETKALYDKVQTHQAAALTLESRVVAQDSLLDVERARTTALEAELRALKEERDILKEKQTKRMADFWKHTMQRTSSTDDWDGEVQKYMGFNKNDKTSADSIPAPTDYPPQTERKKVTASVRPGIQRTFSDPALPSWSRDPDGKAPTTKYYAASMLPTYSSMYKQWSYDVPDDTHRSKLYVKQSAKNMELEMLCRHQQQTIQELQEDQLKEKSKWNALELAGNVSQSQKKILEQQVSSLELNLRLEKEQTESLRGQLQRRQEEFSLKKEQLQSRLQVSKDRTVDVEGQLSSLYVAFELLQEDRTEEQTEQAELKMRLVDADTAIAKQLTQPSANPTEDLAMARKIAEQQDIELDRDASESSKNNESATLRQVAGLLTPSPKRTKSGLGLFSPVLAASSRRASTNDIAAPGNASQSKRRISTGSMSASKGNPPPPPGTTVCKGFLMQLHTKKKKLFGSEVALTWKRHYMVLKRGDGETGAGTYCFWFGDEPQGKVKGTIPHLIRGISTVTFHGNYADEPDVKPHSFMIRVNPNDPKAPEIELAAYSAVELEPWKQTLQEALTIDYGYWSGADQRRAESQMADAMARKYNH